MLIRIITLSFCFVLSACSQNDKVKSDLDNLAERLESFTQISVSAYDSDASLNAPIKNSLAIDVPELQIALREFYAIDDCPLSQFIAERNTALGKTQLPSTRFIYEQRLLSTLKSCMQQLPVDDPMQEQLQGWIEQKQTNLPLVWSNMMTQSDESYLAFTASGGYISGASNDGLQPSKLALVFLINVLNAQTIDSGQLELHLRDLSNARLPAKMWRTQALLSESLPPMSQLLETYIQNNQNACSSAKKEELKIMRNIFTLFFADNIQPLASQLNHYQYQLNPSFETLANHPHIPTDWADYIKRQYLNSAQQYKQTMQQHIELWQQVFKLCE
ncbi:DUF3080 family protein [Glaciecola sp. SC05]|uniref:DUF3080 family protein n=1 Tax=Glaciecola sp. SC05 TaxID=1987355 RepID=UPI003527C57C